MKANDSITDCLLRRTSTNVFSCVCVSLPVPAIQVCVWMTHSHCDADSLPPQSLISNFNWKPEPQLFCSGSKSESILMLLVRAHVKLGGHGWSCVSKTGSDTMFSSGRENTKTKWRLIWGHFILFIKMQFYERYRLDTARGVSLWLHLAQTMQTQDTLRKFWSFEDNTTKNKFISWCIKTGLLHIFLGFGGVVGMTGRV